LKLTNRCSKFLKLNECLPLGIALGGGILLFVFNYGFFYLKLLHNNLFQYVFSLAVFLGIIIGAVLLLRKQISKN